MGDNEHYTSGPWHVAGPRDLGGSLDIDDSEGHHLASVHRRDEAPRYNCHGNALPGVANARLIAAAPEFLVNSKALLALVEQGVLVRNTAGDKASDPALKHLPELRVIDRFEDLVNRVTASE